MRFRVRKKNKESFCVRSNFFLKIESENDYKIRCSRIFSVFNVNDGINSHTRSMLSGIFKKRWERPRLLASSLSFIFPLIFSFTLSSRLLTSFTFSSCLLAFLSPFSFSFFFFSFFLLLSQKIRQISSISDFDLSADSS